MVPIFMRNFHPGHLFETGCLLHFQTKIHPGRLLETGRLLGTLEYHEQFWAYQDQFSQKKVKNTYSFN